MDGRDGKRQRVYKLNINGIMLTYGLLEFVRSCYLTRELPFLCGINCRITSLKQPMKKVGAISRMGIC